MEAEVSFGFGNKDGTIKAGPGVIRCGTLLPWLSNPGPRRNPAGIPLMPSFSERSWSS